MNDFARIRSDYSTDTCLTIAMSEDGDIALKIIGNGEMRIATSGSHFHGEDLNKVIDAFKNVIETINAVTCHHVDLKEAQTYNYVGEGQFADNPTLDYAT